MQRRQAHRHHLAVGGQLFTIDLLVALQQTERQRIALQRLLDALCQQQQALLLGGLVQAVSGGAPADGDAYGDWGVNLAVIVATALAGTYPARLAAAGRDDGSV